MVFTAGQKVMYKYDSSTGVITGKQRAGKWEVRFSEANSFFIPADMLETVPESVDMIGCFEQNRFQGIDDLKRILYRYRLSGE